MGNVLQQKKIVFIGAGNVATHFSTRLQQKGFLIQAVYSKTAESAKTLAQKLGCEAYTAVRDLPEADIYIFCVKDEVLPEKIRQISVLHPQALLIHTAGSISLSVFDLHKGGKAIVYPLQTFSKDRQIDWKNIPILLETDNVDTQRVVCDLVEGISTQIYEVDSEQRKWIHLAAVFACNFTNHCYDVAMSLLKEKGLPSEILLSLIDETTKKVHEMPARKAQTGPAVRNDMMVMSAHERMLENVPLACELYKLLSRSIYEYKNKGQ
ncbi:MAG: DUF2520 domain-containing protein [Bacteroidaceae bacterium]|nr:DUF2520 domain-containing protein [Bacteroidaceae bacterium]